MNRLAIKTKETIKIESKEIESKKITDNRKDDKTDIQIEKDSSINDKIDEVDRAYAALDKMYELLKCGDKRIELSSAKEILNLLGVPEEISGESATNKLEVEIKVI